MNRFVLLQPETVEEASAMLADHEDSRVIAGGTALVLLMKEGLLQPTHLVALRRVPRLDLMEQRDGVLFLGGLVTQHTLEISPRVRRDVPVLAEAAAKVGNIRIRAVSTVGGSLCEGDYQSDLSPTLACLGARVQVHGPEGVRTAPVLDFLRDTYEVDLARGELVTGIEVPLPRPNAAAAYVKHVTGPITDRPCVGVAAVVAVDAAGNCEDLRVALSSVQGVSSRPLLVDAAAAGIAGRRLDDAAIDAVADCAYRRADPPSDLRASAWYRKEMTRVFVRRALGAARARLKTPH
jgi:aerobic carbon-monoxide dehydrogenase medium subunit